MLVVLIEMRTVNFCKIKKLLRKNYKVKKPLLKLCLTGLFIVRALLLYYSGVGCPWRALFNLHCLGCGLTRAFFAFFRLDFTSAFTYHFMFWSVPILYLYVWFDGELTRKKRIDNSILVLIIVGFIIRWVLWYI